MIASLYTKGVTISIFFSIKILKTKKNAPTITLEQYFAKWHYVAWKDLEIFHKRAQDVFLCQQKVRLFRQT